MTIEAVRVYALAKRAKKNNEYTILVDRLWPRGIKKSELELDDWLKNIAPSTELRKWFNHDGEKWPEFKKRYQRELKPHTDKLETIKKIAKKKKVLLLYAAREEQYNHARYLAQQLGAK